MQDHIERWTTLQELDDWLRAPMLLLSLLWLVIVVAELGWGTTQLLTTLGTGIWIIFLLEFAVRFVLAPLKGPFLRRNWLTIIALLVPALRLLRGLAVLRAARALRGFRLVRIVGTANRSMNALRATLKRRQFGYVALLTALVWVLGAGGMLSFEPRTAAADGFTSYGHALWWTGMLIASIGTDFWPHSIEGRVLSALLAMYGLAVFGYIAATFASFFIGRDAAQEDGPVAGSKDLARLADEVRELRQLLTRSDMGQSRAEAEHPAT